MLAQHDDHCIACGRKTRAGEEVHWRRGQGVRCLDCGPDAPARGSTGLEDAPGYVRALAKRLDAVEARCNELEQQNNAQAADAIQLRAWADRLSKELGVDLPEMAE